MPICLSPADTGFLIVAIWACLLLAVFVAAGGRL